MSRVIAGVAGGRRLTMPSGRRTRPTSDRVREALFSTVEAMLGTLVGTSILDLYAGSGAVGLEAASRGATRVTLVERGTGALAALRANVRDLALPGIEVRPEPVERVLDQPPAAPYDVVFCDPPYSESVDAVLAALVSGQWLAPGAVVAVERASRTPPPRWPMGLTPAKSRKYGDTTLCYGSRS